MRYSSCAVTIDPSTTQPQSNEPPKATTQPCPRVYRYLAKSNHFRRQARYATQFRSSLAAQSISAGASRLRRTLWLSPSPPPPFTPGAIIVRCCGLISRRCCAAALLRRCPLQKLQPYSIHAFPLMRPRRISAAHFILPGSSS